MTAEERYKLFDAAIAVLEEDAKVLKDFIDAAEKPANNIDLQLIAQVGSRHRELRAAFSKFLSSINKAKYARVCFR